MRRLLRRFAIWRWRVNFQRGHACYVTYRYPEGKRCMERAAWWAKLAGGLKKRAPS